MEVKEKMALKSKLDSNVSGENFVIYGLEIILVNRLIKVGDIH